MFQQHLSLSHSAFYILSADFSSFCNETNNRKFIKSEFINRLIANFWNEPEMALLDQAAIIDRHKPLSKRGLSKIAFPIYIQKNTENLLAKIAAIGGSLKRGKYLTVMFEVYSQLPYFHREKIYFKEEYAAMQTAIDKKSWLSYNYKDTSRQYYLQPLHIGLDEWSSYNYVVGCDQKNRTIVRRLAYLKNITSDALTAQRPPISDEQRDKIEDEIKRKGIQFVQDKLIDAVVLLSEKGIENFNHMVFLRPAYPEIVPTSRTDYAGLAVKYPYCCRFTCTDVQLHFYFFKFGSDVLLVKPDNLRKDFCKWYEEAWEAYSL